ncbi:MAG: LysR family transcriptional regulator [Frankia sp.]
MDVDVDLRKLRYFVAVAERLHFGRAAEFLHIAQPALSRQIRALEHDLGVRLFDRDRHRVTLTPAGRQLLDDARPLLAAAAATRRRVRRAGDGHRTFTVGFRAGIAVTAAVRAFAAEHPDVTVEPHQVEWDDQVEPLLNGRVEVAFLRPPVAEAGLTLVTLFTEPRVAALPVDHRLAGKGAVHRADLADELFTWPAGAGTEASRRTRTSAGIVVRTVEEKLEHIAAGRAVVLLPTSMAALYQRPDVVYVPLIDEPPEPVFLATVAGPGSPLIDAFTRAARATMAPA